MNRRGGVKGAGFSLVELLTVMAMLGVVMTAIYSTYLSNRKTASAQGEVVEVQQNLRLALDYLSRDLRMAGALLPVGTTPIAAASGSPAFPTYSTTIMINTASADARFARVEIADPSHSYSVAAAGTINLTTEPPPKPEAPNAVDAFAVGDKLRLIRPGGGGQPLSGDPLLVVRDVPGNPSRGSFDGSTPPALVTRPGIQLCRADGALFAAGDEVRSSDLMVKVRDATYPMTVSYYLVDGGTTVNGCACPRRQRCLVRRVNGAAGPADIIATNISALRFAYLDDSYGVGLVPSRLDAVRAVWISLEGGTARTAGLSGGGSRRGLTTVVKLRNRR